LSQNNCYKSAHAAMAVTDSPDHKRAKTEEHDNDKWKLQPHSSIKPPTKESPLLVVVLDGWGEAPDADDNAISLAGMACTALLRCSLQSRAGEACHSRFCNAGQTRNHGSSFAI